mgnify:CR=1 FL=1
MDEIDNALERSRKLTKGLKELTSQIKEGIPDELNDYNDLEQVFDSLENLDGASEHIGEIRSELRDALVTRVKSAAKER